MRTIKNLTSDDGEPELDPSPWNMEAGYYRCKNCGYPDNIRAYYAERVLGVASLINLDGELDDFDSCDSDGFEVNEYSCRNCEHTVRHLTDIAVGPNYRPSAGAGVTPHARNRQRN